MKRVLLLGCALLLAGAGRVKETPTAPSEVAGALARALASDQAAQVELTLDESLRRALRRNVGLLVRVCELEAATARRKGALGGFVPQLLTSFNAHPFRNERWFDQYKSWERTRGDDLNYSLGVGASSPFGTRFDVTWAQGGFNRFAEYDPEVVIENPLDLDNPIPVLVDNEFHTRWAALKLSLNQSLLRGIAPVAHLRPFWLAELGEDAAGAERDAAAAQVAADVLKAYWDLSAAALGTQNADEARQLAEAQREVVAAKIQTGTAPPAEMGKIDETVASRSAELLEARRLESEAGARLKVLMGLEPGDSMAVAELRPVDGHRFVLPDRPRDASMQAALTRNPELTRARIGLGERRIQWKADRHALLPTLDLAASLQLNGAGFEVRESLDDVFANRFPEVNLGISLTLPLPDIAAIEGERASSADVEAALLSVQQAELRIVSGVDTACRSVDSYRRQAEVAAVRERLAAQNVEAAEATYAVGRGTLRDVLEAQQGLRDARQAVVAAEVGERKAQVDLELLRGTLLDVLGVEAL
jgi:outer membrane protein TolC